MQKVCGYLLTGDTNLECLFVLYGKSTRNGKSTLVGTICKLIGDYAGTVNSDTIALKNMANSSSASEDMARLAGVRMASINELDKNFKMGESKVKTMVGGDRLTARFLHENSFEFTPQFKLIINTNHVPTLSDTTMFRSGRMRVIPFNKHFSEAQQDKSLKSKLMSDEALSGILNWCLEGLRLLRAEGLDAPQSVKLSVDEYEKQTDKIAQYIEANLKPNSTERIAGDLMYTNYSLWCRASGYYPLSKANFYDELRSRDFRIDNRARIASGVACNVIFGYEILPPEGFGEPSGAVSNQEPPVGY
jgi:putative DNA primase/helicase